MMSTVSFCFQLYENNICLFRQASREIVWFDTLRHAGLDVYIYLLNNRRGLYLLAHSSLIIIDQFSSITQFTLFGGPQIALRNLFGLPIEMRELIYGSLLVKSSPIELRDSTYSFD